MIYRNRKMVKSEDLNGAGKLFGGKALAWIDEEAAIYAFCQLKSKNLVTAALTEINFTAPGNLGDIIEIGCEVIKFGRTSITIRVSMRNKTTQKEIVTVAGVTFVNVDADGVPTPHGITAESE